MDERDIALAELEAAHVIERVGTDDRGATVWRMSEFPPGREGERLRVIFDRDIVGNRLDDSLPSR